MVVKSIKLLICQFKYLLLDLPSIHSKNWGNKKPPFVRRGIKDNIYSRFLLSWKSDLHQVSEIFRNLRIFFLKRILYVFIINI